MDGTIAQRYLLDAVVTLVDTVHADRQLDDHEAAQSQVGFADRLLLSKTDLVEPDALNALQERLASMNPRASQHAVHFGSMPLDDLLDIRGFNLNATLEIEPGFSPMPTIITTIESARSSSVPIAISTARSCRTSSAASSASSVTTSCATRASRLSTISPTASSAGRAHADGRQPRTAVGRRAARQHGRLHRPRPAARDPSLACSNACAPDPSRTIRSPSSPASSVPARRRCSITC